MLRAKCNVEKFKSYKMPSAHENPTTLTHPSFSHPRRNGYIPPRYFLPPPILDASRGPPLAAKTKPCRACRASGKLSGVTLMTWSCSVLCSVVICVQHDFDCHLSQSYPDIMI